jgi:hypothetical protein
MKTTGLLAALGLAAACSSITETPGGVGSIQVFTPYPPEVEVGQTIKLRAVALSGSGDSLTTVPIYWRRLDTTIAVDSVQGLLTGLIGGQKGRVIARAIDLYSKTDTFTVLARVDTVIRVASDTQTVAAGGTTSTELTVRLEGGIPPVPAAGRRVVYTVILPVFASADDRSVEFSNSALQITATTGTSGTPSPSVKLRLVAGRAPPDSAVVSVTVPRPGGTETAPGSGQVFVIRFAKP